MKKQSFLQLPIYFKDTDFNQLDEGSLVYSKLDNEFCEDDDYEDDDWDADVTTRIKCVTQTPEMQKVEVKGEVVNRWQNETSSNMDDEQTVARFFPEDIASCAFDDSHREAIPVDRQSQEPEYPSEPVDEYSNHRNEIQRLNNAISEFRTTIWSGDEEVLRYMMIGITFRKKQRNEEAISHFKQGLHVEKTTNDETIAFFFEIGRAYEYLDDPQEAQYYYTRLAKLEPHFRDIHIRLATVENAIKQKAHRC